MNDATAIILARAGSKGVPGKNIAPVGGRPCIAWTIEAARRAEGVSRIVVSSDCPRALAVALEMGVMPLRRPAGLASDTARIDDAARHAAEEVSWIDRHRPREARDPFVILYANVPVRPPDLIDCALDLLRRTGCDSVQSYAPVGKHHPWWTARLTDDGAVSPWEGDVLNHGVFRRQELPPAAIPDGGVIALTRAALMLEVDGVPPGPHAFFGRDRRGVMTREGDVVDIDSDVDLLVADALLSRRAAA